MEPHPSSTEEHIHPTLMIIYYQHIDNYYIIVSMIMKNNNNTKIILMFGLIMMSVYSELLELETKMSPFIESTEWPACIIF